MIAGVGIDLIEIERFQTTMQRQGARFLAKVFTPVERRSCEGKGNKTASYAARFAAKEAVLKALGTGLSGGIRWTDVEVAPAKGGGVHVRLKGKARAAAARRRIGAIHLSLTHSVNCAAAVAIAEEAR